MARSAMCLRYESRAMSEPTTIVELHSYDPAWPEVYAREETKFRAALGDTSVAVHHAGSTSIPGRSAKPVIDVVLVVPDARDEPAYVLRLEAAGYDFRFREPEWFEHRFLERKSPRVNLHVFTQGCPEIERMLWFRDWLRAQEHDRLLYERTKKSLATRKWAKMQDYADAKGEVVQAIMARALAAREDC